MKRVFLLAYLLLLIQFCKPPDSPKVQVSHKEPVESTAPVQQLIRAEKLNLILDGAFVESKMQDYLTGVLAAEMPASFPMEALKAQAVAARSYAMYCMAQGKHGQADLCTDSACCQAWQSEETQREKWGEEYDYYAEKIKSAVDATEGQYLSYDGQAILAAFHSSSAGFTEDSGSLWSQLPYLISVESPERAEDVPNYISTLQCSPIDFRDTVLYLKPEADFTASPSRWIEDIRYDRSGRVEKAVLGGVELTGAQLRSLFSLRSTAFTLEYKDGLFCFTVTGYGHGIGMSQYGAKVMAEKGADYRSILAHYYPDTYLS